MARGLLFTPLLLVLAGTAAAQTVVRQPRGESVVVELWSIRDEVEVVPGDLTDPPYIYRAWNDAPSLRLIEHHPISYLRILDRSLANEDERAVEDPWSIELMPADPVSFDLRLDGGKGRFDLTGMRVRDIQLRTSDCNLELEFTRPNPVPLGSSRMALQSSELELHHFLNANARQVAIDLPQSRGVIDLSGQPSAGELFLQISGATESLRFTIPSELAVHVEGPEAARRSFASHASSVRDAIESPGFETAKFRVRLRFEPEVKNVSVSWTAAKLPDIPAAASLPVSSAPGESNAPSPPAAEASNGADRRVAQVLEALDARALVDADAGLTEMRLRWGSDPRLPVLEHWRQSAVTRAEPEAETNPALQAGLKLYLLGEYSNALVQFEAAQRDPKLAREAEAWSRKVQAEIDRLHLTASGPTPPQVVEKVITQTSAPVFALRQPSTVLSRSRSETLEIGGQVGDDVGIDRIEVSLNGAPLVDPAGRKVQVRPASPDVARRMPFTIHVPLQPGENQIVLTAYDVDSQALGTSEHLTVTRLPALWRTMPFLAATGLLLFGIAAWIGISHVVKSRLAFVNRFNPYIAGLPIRDTEMLYGRERLLRNVLNTVHNNSIMLYGPRRIGKTSLQLEIKRRLESAQDPEYRFVPVFIDLQGTVEEHFFASVMGEIIDACQRETRALPPVPDGRSDAYGSREFTRDLRQVITAVQARTEKKLKLVLLLDEVDELNKYSEQTNQKLRSVFMKTFAESLVAVMSGTHIEKRWRSEGSPWYNFFEEMEVRPLDRADAIRLIRAPVRGIFTYDDRAVERILEYSESRPYMIQRFCVHAINRVIDAKRRRVSPADVEAVREQVVASADEVAVA